MKTSTAVLITGVIGCVILFFMESFHVRPDILGLTAFFVLAAMFSVFVSPLI